MSSSYLSFDYSLVLSNSLVICLSNDNVDDCRNLTGTTSKTYTLDYTPDVVAAAAGVDQQHYFRHDERLRVALYHNSSSNINMLLLEEHHLDLYLAAPSSSSLPTIPRAGLLVLASPCAPQWREHVLLLLSHSFAHTHVLFLSNNNNLTSTCDFPRLLGAGHVHISSIREEEDVMLPVDVHPSLHLVLVATPLPHHLETMLSSRLSLDGGTIRFLYQDQQHIDKDKSEREHKQQSIQVEEKDAFYFRYGLNYAVLHHACLLDASTIAISNNNNKTATPPLSTYLAKSNSGFFGTWKFISANNDSSCSNYEEMQGTSMIASPPFSPNIFHAAQTFLTVFHLRLDEQELHKEAQRLLLPTTPRDDYPWSLSLASLVLHSQQQHSQRMKQKQKQKQMQMQILLQGDVTYPVCFEKLVVAGALELSAPFFASQIEAEAFRDLAYLHSHVATTTTTTKKKKKKTPNSALKFTILCRATNRWILNLRAVHDMLQKTGLVDTHWLAAHACVHLEVDFPTLADQVRLFSQTDVLISPHGAALINVMFMRKHSAVIELLSSSWYEPGYQQNALLLQIHFASLAQTRGLEYSRNCAFPAACYSSSSLLIHRRDLNCFGMRQCNFFVDVEALEVLVWQASQAVRILKFNLPLFRHEAASEANVFHAYSKAYVDPLLH